MFQSPKKLMRAVLDVVDDMLVGDDDPVVDEPQRPSHPHDRTVRLRIERRAGSVAARPMHCLCPVRAVEEHERPSILRGA
jgi:hypothetical protein